MWPLLEALISGMLEAAPPLLFASLGAVLCERAGVVNVGIEGMMRGGAFVAAVAALAMPTPAGVLLGMLAAGLLAALHAWLCIRWRADQVVSGMAINLVMLALGTFLLEARFSPNGTPSITQLERYGSGIPLLGGHTLLTPLALLAPFALHVLLQRTRFGLRLRAAGEKPQALAATGVSVSRLRFTAVVAGGLLAGLGGASLSVATLDRFEGHMPAGLGFMAVAAMVFGRWTALGAAGAALFFAFGDALRIGLPSSAPAVLEVVPQGWLLALPYLLTLGVLAAQKKGDGRAPAALGVPYDPELR